MEAQQAQTVGQLLDKIQQTLTQASTAMTTIKNLQSTMDHAREGTEALADGSRLIAGGVKVLVDQTRVLGSGLNDASTFLLEVKRDADKPSMSGFNPPPQMKTRDEYKKGAQIFLSPDGHAARCFVQSSLNPFTTEAMDQINEDRQSRTSGGTETRAGGCVRSGRGNSHRRSRTPATFTTKTSTSSWSRPSSSCS